MSESINHGYGWWDVDLLDTKYICNYIVLAKINSKFERNLEYFYRESESILHRFHCHE